MNSLIFLPIFFLFGIIYFILGYRASKQVTSDQDYYIGGRSLGVVQITCNLIATQLGGGMLLGSALLAYRSGYYGILYTLGMALGFLILAGGVASKLQQCNVTTTAQLFETSYGSPFLKHVASFLSIATMIGILIAQIVSFKSVLGAIGLDLFIIIFFSWALIVGYSMLGGLRAITINDIVQLTIITVVFSGIFFYSIAHESWQWFSWASFSKRQQLFSWCECETAEFMFAAVMMPALFSLIQQDLAQRFFASRSRVVATVSAFNAALFLLLFSFIPVYFGMKARLDGLMLVKGVSPLISILDLLTNDVVFSFILCAIFAAIISTADALMNAVSANITQDFSLASLFGFANSLTFSKLITALVGFFAFAASYYVPQNIIGIIISSYELSVSCLLVPLLFCYYRPRVKRGAAYGGVLFGFIGFFLFRMFPISLPKEVMTLFFSLIGYGLGSIINIK